MLFETKIGTASTTETKKKFKGNVEYTTGAVDSFLISQSKQVSHKLLLFRNRTYFSLHNLNWHVSVRDVSVVGRQASEQKSTTINSYHRKKPAKHLHVYVNKQHGKQNSAA